MQRYFVEQNQIDLNLKEIKIIGSDVHHIKNVMRMKINDEVIVSSNLLSYHCHIVMIMDTFVSLKIDEELSDTNELNVEITIAHGLTTREKREEVVQKITQLGAFQYLPVLMKKCQVKLSDNAKKQTERLQKIAKEASEQSQRSKILEVKECISFNELIDLKSEYDLCLVASTKANKTTDALGDALLKKPHKLLIVVGPEAGIDEKEEEMLLSCGFISVSLGKRILRCEVAPVYIMSVASYLLEKSSE